MKVIIRTYLLIFFSLFSVYNASKSEATTLISVGIESEIEPHITSPFNFLKDLKETIDESKLSFLAYRPNQTEFKTPLYFAFILFFLILITIRYSSPEYFQDLFSSFFKKNYLLSRLTKTKFNISINSIFLDFIYLCVISFFFYLYLYPIAQIEFYLIFGGMLAFTIIQFIIITVSYQLFFGSGNANIHLTNILISNRILGVIFIPILFIITYLEQIYQPYGLNILLLSFAVIIIIRFYRILNQLKFIYNYGFSFILIYICTFELSVYFVCFKIVSIFINS